MTIWWERLMMKLWGAEVINYKLKDFTVILLTRYINGRLFGRQNEYCPHRYEGSLKISRIIPWKRPVSTPMLEFIELNKRGWWCNTIFPQTLNNNYFIARTGTSRRRDKNMHPATDIACVINPTYFVVNFFVNRQSGTFNKNKYRVMQKQRGKHCHRFQWNSVWLLPD